MNLFDYFNQFWKECEKEPFTITETALYHYLLLEANHNRWKMPFRCSTAVICQRLSTTKQNIQKARESLKERKFIDFRKGAGKGKPAEYILLKMSDQLPVQLSDQLSDQLPHNKEDKDINNNISTSLTEDNLLLPTSALRELLLNDNDWQANIYSLLENKGRKIDYSEIAGLVEQFFQFLSVQSITTKTESDCRSHCYNWICKQIELTNKTNYGKYPQKRRGVDVPSAPEANYEGAF